MDRFAPLAYASSADWLAASEKRLMLFGMSGLGKTYASNMLRADGGWFHYSVDYRIGTRYMGELIADSFKREAMKIPALAQLLRTDSIYIASNITFDNLAPLSMYLGKPGDPARGGLTWEDYRKRQEEHRQAEVNALLDTPRFIERARELYGYSHFICDSGGSICEVVAPQDSNDPVLTALSGAMLLVWIKGSDDHTAELVRRFDKAPKPLYFNPDFLTRVWGEYLNENNIEQGDVDPDDFIRWAFARLLAHRQPRYAAMAQNWGITLSADNVALVRSENDLITLIATALDDQAGKQ
ncbi:ATPase [Actibacterium sp. 188UL27-1]|uniref:ATPase n=1 Tax=Actibacterium sp. 188UL27-1 TaxID=2786961 RepID=UPI001959719B|nr:ATPase [Actibacterium sp. 188UL27-1]MBM7068477.1 ATPase [Actibacterium sp. 188UL27-1]